MPFSFELSGNPSHTTKIAKRAVLAAAVCATWRLLLALRRRRGWPTESCSPQRNFVYKEKQASSKKRPGYSSFPLPYPNGWVFVCPSSAVPKAKVLPIEVCGRQFVAFRTENGIVGVLDAYCSHMGTHLGYGGYVANGCVVCPYHEWAFNTGGKLTHVPYAPNGGKVDCDRERNHMKSFPVVEANGMVFVWIHADGAEPWDLTPFVSLPAEKGLRFVGRIIDDDYLMHPMEPSHNSCDWYHFKTVHSSLSQHWLSSWTWVNVDQTINPARSHCEGSVDDDGSLVQNPESLIIDEVINGIALLNGLINLPKIVCEAFRSQVRFSGPLLAHFHIEVACLGTAIIYMPITPTAPFVSHMEFWAFASPRFPWFLAYLLAQSIRMTVNQDREVWENRAHPMPRNRVKGDYNWNKYDQWLKYFYSENSIGWDSPDLTW